MNIFGYNENNNEIWGASNLDKEICKNSVLYYLRATPFTEYGEYNYNGELKSNFFFDNLFSKDGKCDYYVEKVIDEIINKHKKSIILTGNQGCGKTTFLYYLKRQMPENIDFKVLDFDKNTSNPNLETYVEKFSSYLHQLIYKDYEYNNITNCFYYNFFENNKSTILSAINGANNVKKFFNLFHEVFINKNFINSTPDEFINQINSLFFNQILSLIILWHISRFYCDNCIRPVVFCLDNLDVLVNNQIVNGFFEEYFTFARNIDSVIQNVNKEEINGTKLHYNTIFTFIFSCRQHTWAKVKKSYIHQGNIIEISSYEANITDAFDKNSILEKREEYINKHRDFYNDFADKTSNVRLLLEDMKDRHNIYDLFNDDYRQCSITFEKILYDNPDLLTEYINLRKKLSGIGLYGARGLVYKALFDKFKEDDLFELIGVLDVGSKKPPVSNARIILNYLDNRTYSQSRTIKSIKFEKIVRDFSGIVNKADINNSLIQMFNLGVGNSIWNELIAFVQIDSDELDNCKRKKIFITKAGHEYLDLVSTHFEFFNTRVIEKKSKDVSLFSHQSLKPYYGSKKYQYVFQEIIENVLNIVRSCCEKMSVFYESIMFQKFNGKNDYLNSFFVYSSGNTKVFHGERIIHTHIRYIDHFRRFILNGKKIKDENNAINKILVDYIKNYIEIGENNPNILSEKSTNDLFPKFYDKIKVIETSNYTDYTTPINVD